MLGLFRRKPVQQWCVLLYKAPTEQFPQQVVGPFASEADAVNYGTLLSPADFPSTRFTSLPFNAPRFKP